MDFSFILSTVAFNIPMLFVFFAGLIISLRRTNRNQLDKNIRFLMFWLIVINILRMIFTGFNIFLSFNIYALSSLLVLSNIINIILVFAEVIVYSIFIYRYNKISSSFNGELLNSNISIEEQEV